MKRIIVLVFVLLMTMCLFSGCLRNNDELNNENQVEAIARLFEEKETFRMTIAPEGTRKKVDEWRTGFYYIAKAAKVPIIMFTLDFGKKENRFS